MDTKNNRKMYISKTGNILDNVTDEIIVIVPINSSIDYKVDCKVINEDSIHGQLIKRMDPTDQTNEFFRLTEEQIESGCIYDYNGEKVKARLNPKKEFGYSRENMYPIGSYLKIKNYILLVNTNFDENGRAYLDSSERGDITQQYRRILDGLESAINEYDHNQKTIRVPFISSSSLSRSKSDNKNHGDMEKELKNLLDKLSREGHKIEYWKTKKQK